MSPNKPNTFSLDELVFVKLKGYRTWPAKITKILKNNKNKTCKFETHFFGDNTVAQVNESNLFPYEENILKYGIPQIDNFKNKIFNKALQEAELASKARTATTTDALSSDTTTENDGHCSGADQPITGHIHTQQNDTLTSPFDYTLMAQLSTPETGEPSMPTNGLQDIPIQEPLDNIHKKIQRLQDPDNLETSLTLAAEAGNALLAENNKLRQDLFEMTMRNSELAQRLNDINNLTEIRYQERIDELERANDSLQQRNSSLAHSLNELELQISKEKQKQTTMNQVFEEYDIEKEKFISSLEQDIRNLRGIINTYKNDVNQKTTLNENFKNSETQTCSSETHSNSLHFLTELARLKTQQEKMEVDMIALETKQQQFSSAIKQNTFVTDPKRTTVSQSISPVRLDNLNRGDKPKRRETNKFSASLQVQKNKTMQALNNVSSYKSKIRNTKTVNYKIISRQLHALHKNGKPPMNAKIREPNETLDDFYKKNISFYIALSQKALSSSDSSVMLHIDEETPNNQVNLSENISLQNHFLGTNFKPKHQM